MFSHCRPNTKYEAAFRPASLVTSRTNASFRLGTVIQYVYWQTIKTLISVIPETRPQSGKYIFKYINILLTKQGNESKLYCKVVSAFAHCHFS